jgi:hypothetical protein
MGDKTKFDNDNPHAESSNSYRVLADRLLKESTVNGKLDLDTLRFNTKEAAQKIVFSMHGIDLSTRHGGVADLVADQIDNITLATREMLGIVPQSEWKHSARDALSNLVERIATALSGDVKPTHGLVCKQGGKETGYVDPAQSLASQNISCSIPAKPGRSR